MSSNHIGSPSRIAKAVKRLPGLTQGSYQPEDHKAFVDDYGSYELLPSRHHEGKMISPLQFDFPVFTPSAMMSADYYKHGHFSQYPKGTQEVFANITARSAKIAINSKRVLPDYDGKVLLVGTQSAVQGLVDKWNHTFFNQPRRLAVARYKRIMDLSLGKDFVPVEHIVALHDLGYLPLEIRAIDEGQRVPLKVPMMTLRNTLALFFWLTNFIETTLSANLWPVVTAATQAYEFRRQFEAYAKITGTPRLFVKFQGHNFSYRGMEGDVAAAMVDFGHQACFFGTDTSAGLEFAEYYYDAPITTEFIAGSIAATEHAVMCAGGKEDEFLTYKRLIEEVRPTGGVSIVGDTWKYSHVIDPNGGILAQLKDSIMARLPDANGLCRTVCRGDSGDPVAIILGDKHGFEFTETQTLGSWSGLTPLEKGTISCLAETFGAAEPNEQGYRAIDTHIGAIYGDAITLVRSGQIQNGIAFKGFTTGNMVFGMGSYIYQYVTRDTFGMAMKTTGAVINGEEAALFKDPETDVGSVKRSAKGYLVVIKVEDSYELVDELPRDVALNHPGNELKVIWRDGEWLRRTTQAEIRGRVDAAIDRWLETGDIKAALVGDDELAGDINDL